MTHVGNSSAETKHELEQVIHKLDALIEQVRTDIKDVKDGRTQGLLEATAEVLLGLKKAYADFTGGVKEPWD